MNDSQDLGVKKNESYKQRDRTIEVWIWSVAGLLINLPVFVQALVYKSDAHYIVTENYDRILEGMFIILIPALFKIIFGKLPFEMMRTRNVSNIIHINGDYTHISEESLKGRMEDYTFKVIIESTVLSEKIYNRAGAYLLVGLLIAFGGVSIFYSPMFPVTKSTDIQQRLIDLLPRFGALFFLEFIAFFFLKQYRIMLAEFRYYEAIKRKRQDNLNLLTIIEQYKDNVDLLKIITDNLKFNNTSDISGSASSEIIETQKIANADLDFMAKMTEMIKAVRAK